MSESTNDPHLIAEHDTWISFDPVLGCPADCAYCYLGELGLRATKPQVRVPLDEMVATVGRYFDGRRSILIDPFSDRTPICIGNYTDMLMTPDNRRLLVQIIERLAAFLHQRRIILITKARLDAQTVDALDRTGVRILWFFSQSFASEKQGRLERGSTADVETTIANAELINRTANQKAVHFWRPFVRELVPPPRKWEDTLRRFQAAGILSSVVIGMKRGATAPATDPRLLQEIPSAVEEQPVGSEVIDQAAWEKIRDVARTLRYPMYRHSSCAIALADEHFEQLGTWRLKTLPQPCETAHCPTFQRELCGGRRGRDSDREQAEDFARSIAKFLDLDHSAIRIGPDNRSIAVDALVAEFDFNVILHASAGRYAVFADSIAPQKAWQGTFLQQNPADGILTSAGPAERGAHSEDDIFCES